jgi:hypothetical protein
MISIEKSYSNSFLEYSKGNELQATATSEQYRKGSMAALIRCCIHPPHQCHLLLQQEIQLELTLTIASAELSTNQVRLKRPKSLPTKATLYERST